MAFGIYTMEFLGAWLSGPTAPFKVKLVGQTLTVQGKLTTGGNLAPLNMFSGEPGPMIEFTASVYHSLQRSLMPPGKTMEASLMALPLFADGTIRLWAKNGWWKASTTKLRLTMTTRVFQATKTLVDQVDFAKTWKKKGGKRYVTLQSGMLPGTIPPFKAATNQDLYVERQTTFRLYGDGKRRYHFGWPDTTKYLVSLTRMPPMLYTT